MPRETISIQVDPEAAQACKAAPRAHQKKMEALLGLWLRGLAAAKPADLKEVMSRVGRNARARALTPEVLESLLKEA